MSTVSKIISQTSWQVIGKALSSLSTLLILIIISRSYGHEGLGIYTLALTYLAFFYLAADLGLNAYILPRLEKSIDEASKLFNIRFIWSIILFFLANILILPFKDPQLTLAVLLGSMTIIFSGIYTSSNLIFQSKLRYDLSVIASSALALANLLVIYLLVYLKVSAPVLILGSIAGWIVCIWVVAFLLRGLYEFKLVEFDFKHSLVVLKSAWPISLTLLLNVVYFRIDTFFLKNSFSFVEVGIYNYAYQFFQTALTLPTFIMNSYYPLMLTQLSSNKELFVNQLKNAAYLLLGISLFGVFMTFILAPTLISLLSGEDFSSSASVLKVLSLSFPAFFLSSLFMWTLISLKKYRQVLMVYLIGLLVNLFLNYIFIPKYSYIAAALVTGISEYIILFLLMIICSKLFKYGTNN